MIRPADATAATPNKDTLSSPYDIAAWAVLGRGYKHIEKCLDALREGVDTTAAAPSGLTWPPNHHSIAEHREAVSAYIKDEL